MSIGTVDVYLDRYPPGQGAGALRVRRLAEIFPRVVQVRHDVRADVRPELVGRPAPRVRLMISDRGAAAARKYPVVFIPKRRKH